MNFLAHLYLSGSHPDVMLGNFIGDYVKGRQHEKFAPMVRQGILLHRKIDHFTDRHPIVKESTIKFKKGYGRYSGIVVDVLYDHFLALNWETHNTEPLNKFVSDAHKILIKNYFKLPSKVKSFLPFLIKNRRLFRYQYLEELERVYHIMAKYSSLPEETEFAMKVINREYDALQNEFKNFFKDVNQMVKAELQNILS